EVEQLHPDVAIVDIEMPGVDGLSAIASICQRYSNTKVLVFSSYDDEQYIQDALKAGAKGYLLKSTPAEDIADAIRSVHKGYVQLGPGLLEKITFNSARGTVIREVTELETASPPSEKTIETSKNDWTDSTKELLDTLPQVWTRGILYIVLIFTAIVLPWSMLSQVDITGIARGRLEPKGKTIRLDAQVSGTVAAIGVREGQQVKAGQSLMELNSQIVTAELQQAQARLQGFNNRLTNLQVVENQLRINMRTQKLQNQAEISEQTELVNQTQQKIESDRATIESTKKLLSKDLETVNKYLEFSKKGVVSGAQLDDAQRRSIENEQRFQQARSQLQQNQTELKRQQQAYQKIMRQGERNAIDADRQFEELQSQIIDVRSQIEQTSKQIKSLQYQQKQNLIRVPVDGTVFQLSVRHPGAVVQPGQMLANIAPKGVPLILRAQMSTKDSGFLRIGMPVKIKFDAYPFQDYGVVPGRLNWISPDSNSGRLDSVQASRSELISNNDRPTTANPSNEADGTFELEIVIDRNYIKTADRTIILAPGQTATAEVIIRQRRIIDFVLEPFKKLQKSGLQM
ncbi:MAG: HlyD family efflux transporter periplasmic adaptor subunit, partial [Xenococcaceae cyanobacterium]